MLVTMFIFVSVKKPLKIKCFRRFPLFMLLLLQIVYTIFLILKMAVKKILFSNDKIAISLDFPVFPAISQIVTQLLRSSHVFDIYFGSPQWKTD